MVTKAEDSYNRILGYSKNVDGHSDYWKNQLPSYHKTIDLAKAEVQKAIESLAQKGVNVEEIEAQTIATEEKIIELDKVLEELPTTKLGLILKYKKEKQERIKLNNNIDNVKERYQENSVLFSSSVEISANPDSKNHNKFRESNTLYIQNEKKDYIAVFLKR